VGDIASGGERNKQLFSLEIGRSTEEEWPKNHLEAREVNKFFMRIMGRGELDKRKKYTLMRAPRMQIDFYVRLSWGKTYGGVHELRDRKIKGR